MLIVDHPCTFTNCVKDKDPMLARRNMGQKVAGAQNPELELVSLPEGEMVLLFYFFLICTESKA